MPGFLSRPWERWLIFLAVLFLAGALIFTGSKNALAEYWGASTKPGDWLKAAEAEPDNAQHWYRLGRFRELDFTNRDLPLAIVYYRRATAIDPRSATYWMDLASVYELQGDLAEARQAWEMARSVYPLSAEVAWRYGNYLLRRRQLPEAFAELRRAVLQDARRTKPEISLCWRSSHDIESILDQALPAESGVYLEVLEFLVTEHQADAALVVWKRLLALEPSFELRRGLPLIDELIQQDRVQAANEIWQQALRAAGWSEPPLVPGSLVWDGGFEGEFSNGGFGWQQKDIAGAAVEFDKQTRHARARSLRITFDGTANVDFSHVFQIIPVQPNTRYHFAAYLRTEAISTDSGIRFWIFDLRNPGALNVLTPNLVGTEPWAPSEADFSTGPGTHMVKIALRRLPSSKFDNKIQGSVWVDAVSLVPLAELPARRSP